MNQQDLIFKIALQIKTYQNENSSLTVITVGKGNSDDFEPMIADLIKVGIDEKDFFQKGPDIKILSGRQSGTAVNNAKILREIEQAWLRLKAFRTLRGWGGLSMNDQEKRFFENEDKKIEQFKKINKSNGMGD